MAIDMTGNQRLAMNAMGSPDVWAQALPKVTPEMEIEFQRQRKVFWPVERENPDHFYDRLVVDGVIPGIKYKINEFNRTRRERWAEELGKIFNPDGGDVTPQEVTAAFSRCYGITPQNILTALDFYKSNNPSDPPVIDAADIGRNLNSYAVNGAQIPNGFCRVKMPRGL